MIITRHTKTKHHHPTLHYSLTASACFGLLFAIVGNENNEHEETRGPVALLSALHGWALPTAADIVDIGARFARSAAHN